MTRAVITLIRRFPEIFESRMKQTEIYDQNNNYKNIEESESERLEWQKRYLDFLIETRPIAERKIKLHQSKPDRTKFAVPEWLRIAKIQMQVADGDITPAMKEAKSFIGIETSADVLKINPPSVSRLNEILEILRKSKTRTEARELFKAFYARGLALEQYTTSNLSGLARILF